jgi:RNA polymerase sigma-70 factor (ECF subfamily)
MPHDQYSDATSNPVEQDLVTGLRNGDTECFERLVRQYGARMLNVANHIVRNDADAQDCVQEAFLKVLKHIDQFEGRASVGSWLHKIVANTALMRLRSQVRKKEDSLSELLPEFNTEGNRIKANLPVPGPSVQESLQSIQEQAIVRQAIDQLPESYRAVLIARDIEGFDTHEAAEILNLQPGAVKTRLHRARGALKTLLEPAIKAGIL